MMARLFNLILAAAAGALLTSMVTSCTSGDVGGTNAAVSGAGAACTVKADCATGLECEHGTCQPDVEHGDAGVANHDQGDDDAAENENENENENHDAGTASQCSASLPCANGMKCDDGVCKLDDSGDDGDSSGSGSSGDGSGGDDSGGHDGMDG
jgi:hypothetical protein